RQLHRCDVPATQLAVLVNQRGRDVDPAFAAGRFEIPGRARVPESAATEMNADPDEAILIAQEIDVVIPGSDGAELRRRLLAIWFHVRCRPGFGIVEELVVDLLFVGATDAKRNRAGHVVDNFANAVLDRVKGRIETDGHVSAADVEANAGNADLLLVGNDATDRLCVTEMAIGAHDAGDDVADRHAIAHLRNRRVVGLAERLGGAVLELGGLRLFGGDRIRGVNGVPRQMLFARNITESAPDRHRPLAWPLDSAVGVEAGFASHF